jgi:carbonic anhydrase
MQNTMDSAAALARLKRGNAEFMAARLAEGDVSPELRKRLSEEGQHPFACVITCSDSRVVPEAAFSCGLGQLFCVRTAGNTVGASELGSVVYACEHLGMKLVVVLGHTGCGAVEAALHGGEAGAVAAVTAPIAEAVGEECDPQVASVLNVRAGVQRLQADEQLAPFCEAEGGLRILGALYHTDTGQVEFLDR